MFHPYYKIDICSLEAICGLELQADMPSHNVSQKSLMTRHLSNFASSSSAAEAAGISSITPPVAAATAAMPATDNRSVVTRSIYNVRQSCGQSVSRVCVLITRWSPARRHLTLTGSVVSGGRRRISARPPCFADRPHDNRTGPARGQFDN